MHALLSLLGSKAFSSSLALARVAALQFSFQQSDRQSLNLLRSAVENASRTCIHRVHGGFCRWVPSRDVQSSLFSQPALAVVRAQAFNSLRQRRATL